MSDKARRPAEGNIPHLDNFEEAVRATGYGRSTIYKKTDPRSKYYDPTFPKPIRLGDNTRRIFFVHAEIEQWVSDYVAAARGQGRGE